MAFHAAVWGPGGALEVCFPEKQDRDVFLESEDGLELRRMVARLRRRDDRTGEKKPTVTVTVRVPKGVHEVLVREAAEENLSLHRLCLAKLVQPLVEA